MGVERLSLSIKVVVILLTMVMDTLHLQRLVSLQISLSPSVPVLAFTGTATRDTRCEIISILELSYSVVTECNPNCENIFFMVHI